MSLSGFTTAAARGVSASLENRKTRRRLAGLIFLVSLGVRLVLLYGLHHYEINTSETMWIARSLAKNGAFADPYLVATGPTAHSAPIYPVIGALFYKAFGVTPQAERARFVSNAVAASAGYALLPAVAESLGLGWISGATAALAGALVPLHYWPECVNDFENAWTGLFLEAATLWLARLLRGRRPPAAASGVMWGAALLLAPTVAPVQAAFLAVAVWKRRVSAGWIAALVAGIIVTLAPWTIRNYAQLGGLTFVRDDLGLELFVSNHDEATPVFDRNAKSPYWAAAHPHASLAAAEEIRREGELNFERRKLRQAAAWITDHPARFAQLTAARGFYFWFPSVPKLQWAQSSVTLLAAFGWLWLWRERRFAATALTALLAAYSAPFWIIQVTLRYQHPVWWALLLMAVSPVALRFEGPASAERA